MSMGPTNIAGTVAGAPLAQTHGPEGERRALERAAQQRSNESAQQAEVASGIGETDGKDNNPHERDADGRRVWERGTRRRRPDPPVEEFDGLSRDATGERGRQLDLSG